jgi:Na+/proline symporter
MFATLPAQKLYLRLPTVRYTFVSSTTQKYPQNPHGLFLILDFLVPSIKMTFGSSTVYSVAAIVSIVGTFFVGISAMFFVRGDCTNFFVCGRTLPVWMVSLTLAGSFIDATALLSNADSSYRYSFYDGAVIAIGLVLSLLLNGVFLAHYINQEKVLTLPDIFARRYGVTVEIIISIAEVIAFVTLVAGNFVGFARITSYLWDISPDTALVTAAIISWMYTVSGGMFSTAFAGVVQACFGLTGCAAVAVYLIINEENGAPPPSIGYPGM